MKKPLKFELYGKMKVTGTVDVPARNYTAAYGYFQAIILGRVYKNLPFNFFFFGEFDSPNHLN